MHWCFGRRGQDWNGKNDYYVFVRYYDEQFEAFIESAEKVIKDVNARLKEEKKRGVKEWAPRWYLSSNIKKHKYKWRAFSRFHKFFNDTEIDKIIKSVRLT